MKVYTVYPGLSVLVFRVNTVFQIININPSLAEHDMPCLSKQCRSRSVGFFVTKPTDLDLHCLPFSI